MNTIQRIAKNTSLIFVGNIVSYVLAFIYIMYAARYLGVEEFGVLSFAIAFAGIFGVFTDLGLGTLTTREVSRDLSLAGKYFFNVAIIKIFLAIMTIGIIVLTVNLLNYPQNIANVIYLVALAPIFGNFTGLCNSIFQAYQKMEYFSIAQILSSVLIFVGFLTAINYNLDVVGFALFYFIASVIVFIYSMIICFWKFISPSIKLDLSFWKPTLKEALPFGVTGMFLLIYFYIDSIMLSFMVGNEAVGIYNVAYRFLVVLLFIPTLFSIAIFPVMSKFFVTSIDSLKFAFQKYFKYITIIGVPIAVGTTLLADIIILQFFGVQYAPSVPALQILVWAGLFIYMSSTFVRVLESVNKQIIMTKITIICAIINIVLNLMTIPILSYIGSSISTVATEFIALIIGIYACSRLGYTLDKKNIVNLLKIFLASTIMGIFIICLKWLNIMILIPLATIIYFMFLFLLNEFDEEDMQILERLIGN